MTTHKIHFRGCAFVLLLLLCCGSARAQRFEYFSTASVLNDDGRFGVTNLTAVNGYAAVGTTVGVVPGCPNGNSDVLLSRINLNGASPAGWPLRYNIGTACTKDMGKCVIECRAVAVTAGNLVVLGWTAFAGTCGTTPTNTFLMSVNNGTGAVNWVRIYPNVLGERVVEAKFGDGITTFAGDLIFCGTTNVGLPFIARVAGAGVTPGALIWNQTYSVPVTPAPNGDFADVIECEGPCGVGDVAATGNINGIASIIRVDGNTGLVGPGPMQGLGQYGVATDVKLKSLQELRIAPYTGHLVATGYHTMPTTSIYVIQTKAHPCVFVADITHTAGTEEQAWAIREIIPTSSSGLTAGDLVLTGYTRATAAANPDMFLLELLPGTLTVTGLGFHLYDGAGAGRADFGYSLMPIYQAPFPATQPTDGFILCGVSDQSAVGRLNEMYIVKTNALGQENSACDDGTVTPVSANRGLAVTCPAVANTQPMVSCPAGAVRVVVGSVTNCFIMPRPAPGVNGSTNDRLMLSSVPNPVRSGNDVALKISFEKEAKAVVTVVDMSGTVVATFDKELRAGENKLLVNTKELSSGTYTVTVTAGENTTTTRVVIE